MYNKGFIHHTKAVYGLDFVGDSTYLVAGGDDMCLSYMDFSIGKLNYKLNKVHTDFVRTVRAFTTNHNNILSASYDKTVKVWDIRQPETCSFMFKHEAEVEDAKIYNGDVNLVTVGGRLVRIFLKVDQNLGYENE